MAELAGPFNLLQAGPHRYLCYCGPGPGGTVYVTDALEVWAGELGCVHTGAAAAGPTPGPGLGKAVSGRTPSPPQRCQPGEHGTKLREALGRGAASLSLGEGKATLQLQEEAGCSTLHLFKLPIAEARSQLQALVFGMAGRIEILESRLEVVETLASSCSPEKNTVRSQLFLPARRHHLEWTSRTPDLCCPGPDDSTAGALSTVCGCEGGFTAPWVC
ncbi:protein PAXX isoform 2-T2 [Rhynochetos jubatus]